MDIGTGGFNTRLRHIAVDQIARQPTFKPFDLQPQRWRCPARSIRREVAFCSCVSVTSNLLNRSVTERPQNGIDARLIASTLRLEPFEHILIHSQ